MRLVLAMIALAAPSLARADTSPEAKLHVDRATAYHQDGRFGYALGELEVAYALDPQPELLFAIGQVEVKLGACGRAIRFYQRFLATSHDGDARAAASEAIAACTTGPAPEPDHV